MIVKNSVNYKKLFEKASNLLKQYNNQPDDFYIDNIDEYFQHIKTLAAIENKVEGMGVPAGTYIDPIYTILPADEELFEIDANTREIKIPDHFKKHGVGVTGDEIAEIIYFSIDRYFDAIDLANMEILIEWRRVSKDDNISEQYDFTYKRSLEYKSGNIVFGWPISSKLTAEAGDIQFAVRFYELDESKTTLLYSFSTKPAIIKVQPGLDFEISGIALQRANDYAQNVYNMIRNTTTKTPGYVIAEPKFINYLISQGDNDNFIAVDTDHLTHDLSTNTKFKTRAQIDDNDLQNGEKMGISGLTYEWYHRDHKNSITPIVNTSAYEKVANTNLLPNEYYYYKDEGGDYHIYTSDVEPQDLYQKYSVITPSQAGTYFAKAINTYNFNELRKGVSAEWYVPYPESPIINNEEQTVRINNEDNSTVIAIDIPTEQPTGTIVKKWYYNANSAEFDDSVHLQTNQSEITVEKEGYYFLELTNSRNGSSITAVSKPVRVLHAPGEIISIDMNSDTSVNIANQPQLSIKIKLNKPYSSTFEYQWFKSSDEGATWSPVSENVNSTTSDVITYSPSGIGTYKCEVTNIYEDMRSNKMTSDKFEVYTLKGV